MRSPSRLIITSFSPVAMETIGASMTAPSRTWIARWARPPMKWSSSALKDDPVWNSIRSVRERLVNRSIPPRKSASDMLPVAAYSRPAFIMEFAPKVMPLRLTM